MEGYVGGKPDINLKSILYEYNKVITIGEVEKPGMA